MIDQFANGSAGASTVIDLAAFASAEPGVNPESRIPALPSKPGRELEAQKRLFGNRRSSSQLVTQLGKPGQFLAGNDGARIGNVHRFGRADRQLDFLAMDIADVRRSVTLLEERSK